MYYGFFSEKDRGGREMLKQLKKLAFSRMGIVGILIVLQLALIFVAAIEFSRYFVFYSVAVFILAIVFFIKIINTDQNMAYKLAWSMVVCVFPAFGVAVYMLFGGTRLSKHVAKKTYSMNKGTEENLSQDQSVLDELEEESPLAAKQTKYILNTSACPVFRNNSTKYFPSGEIFLETFLTELEAAEKYIFLEYFIIGKGEMWDRIHEILLRKVNAGVDVRVIYDDIGSILVTDLKFDDKLRSEGIKCHVFHRFVPLLTGVQNNRDHRKICVIDGLTAFTGGLNISDEYINKLKRFGYWKDNAVMMKGESAWSFAVMFLSMWEELEKIPEERRGNYSEFRAKDEEYALCEGQGFIQPYKDSPLDYETTGENMYINIISSARDYVWITTPYLIIDERMEQALCLAAKSGVDVRIITPRIPDKKFVKKTTESFYPKLIMSGVKIYEFLPGFIHSKTFLCDDRIATVGTINLDYRSFYLHFECGVWMYSPDCLGEIKKDLIETFERSELMGIKKTGVVEQATFGILGFLAPLL